jgi:uncharacterized membrane protein
MQCIYRERGNFQIYRSTPSKLNLMREYILLSGTAWFMGFFPMLEIYLAIPSVMAMGLDPVSAVLWASFGNFIPVPLLVFFSEQLARIGWIGRRLEKMANSRFSQWIQRWGYYAIVLFTPIISSWVVGMLGSTLGLNKSRLFTAAAVSILLYGILIALLTGLGIDLLR